MDKISPVLKIMILRKQNMREPKVSKIYDNLSTQGFPQVLRTWEGGALQNLMVGRGGA